MYKVYRSYITAQITAPHFEGLLTTALWKTVFHYNFLLYQRFACAEWLIDST